MKNQEIALIQLVDGGTITDARINSYVESFGDVIITEEEIKRLAEIEMEDGSHDDYEEDYNSKLGFYLSNVKLDSYLGVIESILDDKKLRRETLGEIQTLVENYITEHIEE